MGQTSFTHKPRSIQYPHLHLLSLTSNKTLTVWEGFGFLDVGLVLLIETGSQAAEDGRELLPRLGLQGSPTAGPTAISEGLN